MQSIGYPLFLFLMLLPLVFFLAVFYLTRRWIGKRLPEAVMRQASKNARVFVPIVMASVVTLVFIIGFVSARTFSQPLLESFIAGSLVFLAIMFAALLGIMLHQKSVAGEILLDCGPHPLHRVFLYNGVVLLFLGLLMFALCVSLRSSEHRWTSLALLALPLMMASIGPLIMASGRLQIRQNGIWSYWGLLRWDKLRSYRWEGETDCTLILQVKTRFRVLGNGALPVPIEQKHSLDELLNKHCPGTT
jgi:protein-S-isoprenylcysteine O-methyltransferase Ste14